MDTEQERKATTWVGDKVVAARRSVQLNEHGCVIVFAATCTVFFFWGRWSINRPTDGRWSINRPANQLSVKNRVISLFFCTGPSVKCTCSRGT